jgi:hypothetical protein
MFAEDNDVAQTLAPDRWAKMRLSPSCLISCSHPKPVGGRSVGLGKHGSMKPLRLVRVRDKTMTGKLIGTAQESSPATRFLD